MKKHKKHRTKVLPESQRSSHLSFGVPTSISVQDGKLQPALWSPSILEPEKTSKSKLKWQDFQLTRRGFITISCLLETTTGFFGTTMDDCQGTKEPGLVHGEESPPENWKIPSPQGKCTKSSYVQKGLSREKKILQMINWSLLTRLFAPHESQPQQSKGNTY